ncbi:MAG: YjbQ family protein [Deltaproteobacteria bacterium]|nr:MAG: YjbQ family protein [Deltaproteobacteria bacterium]
MVHTGTFSLETEGFCDFHDVTARVEEILRESGIVHGTLTVFTIGSTCGITTIEFESGVLNDLKRAIERIAPEDIPYDHDRRWGDGNGFSHVRAALMKPSLSIPVVDGKLLLGTWQQIVFIDFDNRKRKREIVVQVVGE